MSKVYVASSCQTMPDGSLAFGFHRCNLNTNAQNPIGYWKCQDCGKQWSANASQRTFDKMRDDYDCNT